MGGKAKLLGRRLETAQVSWLPSVSCFPSVPTTSWEAGRLPQGVVHLIMVLMMVEALNVLLIPSCSHCLHPPSLNLYIIGSFLIFSSQLKWHHALVIHSKVAI